MRAAAWALALAALAAGCAAPEPQPPGPSYPREVLGGAPWTDLVVEIDHAPGHRPSDAALAHLEQTLRNVTAKERVRLVVRQELPAEARTWNESTLLALEASTRDTVHAAPTALLHVLYPAGEYNGSGAAGVTIAGTALGPAVVFLDTIRRVTLEVEDRKLPLPLPDATVAILERATLLHEVGHAFGLVDNGLPMVKDHEDPAHEGHSRNPDSVMFWRVESVEGLRETLAGDGRVPDRFDADDLADIRGGGGRG